MTAKQGRAYAEKLAEYALRELAEWEMLDNRFKALKDVPTGTVIRFERRYEVDGVVYSFAALKVVGGLWYLTKKTTSRVESPLNYDGLIVFLGTAVNIKVATRWEIVDENTGELVFEEAFLEEATTA